MQIPANTPDDVRLFIVKHLQTLASIRRRQAMMARALRDQRAGEKLATDLEFVARQMEQSYIVQRG
jgi:hypothetical protein